MSSLSGSVRVGLPSSVPNNIPCVVVASLETDAFVAFVVFFDMLMVRSILSVRSRKQGAQGAVTILRERRVQGCVSRNSDPTSSIQQKARKIGIERSGGTHQTPGTKQFRQRKDNLEALSKKVNLMSEIPARPVLRNEHLRKPHDKQIVTAKQRGIWQKKHNAEQERFKLR